MPRKKTAASSPIAAILTLLLIFGNPHSPASAREQGKDKISSSRSRLEYQQYTDTQSGVTMDAFVMRAREGTLKTEFITRPPGALKLNTAQLLSPEGVVYGPLGTYDISEAAARNLGRLRPIPVPKNAASRSNRSRLGALALGTALGALSSVRSTPTRTVTGLDAEGHPIERAVGSHTSFSPVGLVAGLAPAALATQSAGSTPEGVEWMEPQTARTGHFSSVAEFTYPPATESQAPWQLKVVMTGFDGSLLTFIFMLLPGHFVFVPVETPTPPTVTEAPPEEGTQPPEEGLTPPPEEGTKPPEEKGSPPTEEGRPPTEEEKGPPTEEERPPTEEEKPPTTTEERPPVGVPPVVTVTRTPPTGPGITPPGEGGTLPPDEGVFPPPEEPPWLTTPPVQAACCEKVGNQILFPVTKDPLSPPATQEAWNNPAVGAHKVFLHDGSFYEQAYDLFVESVGMDFNLARTYRSNVTTEAGGLFGHKWDNHFNKRLLHLGGTPTQTGIKAEPATNPGDILYYNGAGRADRFTHLHSEERNVKNFHKDFRAWVSTYKAPAGLFAELERYVVLPHFLIPFSEHPNFEGRIFYVLRFKNGYREIFNCRGQVIYIQDRNENTMTFIYSTPLHPLTMNPILTKVIDTSGRVYRFDYVEIARGLVDTFYQGRHVRSPEPMMRLKSVTDFEGRSAEYRYQGFDTVPILEFVDEKLDRRSFTTQYGYEGEHLLKTIKNPREVAARREPFLTNQWNGNKVVEQTLGLGGLYSQSPEEGKVGGIWKIQSGERSEVRDRENHLFRYTLTRKSDSYVIRTLEEPLEGGGSAVTTYDYNGDYQVTKVKLPEGNGVIYEYDTANEAVIQGDVRDWVESGVTYENNLSKGNLLLRKLFAGSKRNELPYSEIVTQYQYEDLFNQEKHIEGPGRAVTDFKYDHGWYATPGNNGNPLEEIHPRRTRSEGDPFKEIKTIYTYKPTGLLETVTDPRGHVTTYTYQDRTGYLLSMTTPEGNLSYEPDLRGNVKRFTDERGTVFRFDFNQRDLVDKEVMDENGFQNEIIYTYDDNNNLIEEKRQIQDNIPDRREFSRVSRRTPERLVITREYNLLNRLIRETHRAGDLARVHAYGYDANERLVRLTTPEAMAGRDTNNYVEMDYDSRGLLKKITYGGNHVRKIAEIYGYDKNGNRITRNVEGVEEKTFYESDGFDRPFKTTTPLGTVLKEFLNPSGLKERVEIRGKNHAGQVVDLVHNETVYDEFNAVIQTNEHILNPEGRHLLTRITKYVRDEEGKVVKILDPEESATVFDYTGTVHRVFKETDPLGNEIIYAYTPDGNITLLTEKEKEVAYVFPEGGGRVQRQESIGTYVTRMDYDALGRLSELTDPGAHTTLYAYDSMNSARAMAAPGGRLDLYEQDGFGRTVKEIQSANLDEDRLITDKTYDLNDRIQSVEIRRGSLKVQSLAYTYYPTDRIHTLTQDGNVYRYGYDATGNLETEIMPNGIRVGRLYDAEDRLIDVRVRYRDTTTQTGSSRESYQYDGMGRVTRAERYRGWVVNQMSYNSLGLPVTDEQVLAGQSFTLNYEYNRRGLKEWMTVPALPGIRSQTFQYVYDPLGRVSEISNLTRRDFRFEMSYEYSGRSRLARRSLLPMEDAFYEYNPERELSGIKVVDRGGRDIHFQMNIGYANFHRPQSLSSRFFIPDKPTSSITAQDYTPFGAQSKTNQTEIAEETVQGGTTYSASSTRRLNDYQDGRLTEAFNYFETFANTPGMLFGRNVHSTVRGEKIQYVYEGNRIQRTEFHRFGSLQPGLVDLVRNFLTHQFSSFHHYLEGGLSDDAVRQAMSGRGERVQVNPFGYDRNGNMTSDDRFHYSFDYRDRLSRVVDTFNFGRHFDEECRYFYDYLNRLVYVQHEPVNQRDVQIWRANARILYDGMLPYAELKTDFSGNPAAPNAFFVTHPEGSDVGRMFLRVRPGTELEEYHPFFDGEGALIHLSDRYGQPVRVGYEFDAADRRTRLKHIILGRPQNSRVEIPLSSLRTRWEPFAELAVVLTEGQFIFDHSRNIDQEWIDIVDAAGQALQEKMAAFQKKAMILLGAQFLPFLLASPWVGVLAFSDVVIDYGFSVLTQSDYSLSDAVLSFETGVVSGAFGQEMKLWDQVTSESIARSAKLFAKQAGRVTEEVMEETLRLSLPEITENIVKRGYRLSDWVERVEYWSQLSQRQIVKYLIPKMKKYLQEGAERGGRFERDLLKEIDAGTIQIAFRPDISKYGIQFTGTNVLVINPLRMDRMVGRNVKELTSTLLHEYVHYRGFNEWRAHWEQFRFLIRLTATRGLSRFPEMGHRIAQFVDELRQGGSLGAARFIQNHVIVRYTEIHAGKPFRQMLDIGWYQGGLMKKSYRLMRKRMGLVDPATQL